MLNRVGRVVSVSLRITNTAEIGLHLSDGTSGNVVQYVKRFTPTWNLGNWQSLALTMQ